MSKIILLHCPDCFYMSHSFPKMCEHFFSHQENVEWQIYQCPFCFVLSSHDDLLNEHMLSLHNKELKNKNIDKDLIIDSIFIPKFPNDYSLKAEITPRKNYVTKYNCPLCDVVYCDPESFRTHIELIHQIDNIERLDNFLRVIKDSPELTNKKNSKIKVSKESAINMPEYKKPSEVKSASNFPEIYQSEAVENLINQYTRICDNKHQVQVTIDPKYTSSTEVDDLDVRPYNINNKTQVLLERAHISMSYDPEPLRFLRNLIRAGIPASELSGFSWKGNRRGRPRHQMSEHDNNSYHQDTNAISASGRRKSMKDDMRMRAFIQLVQQITGKPLPDNLGTHMHQFLSNLRNKNS